ncbi:hypothetical protein KP004_14310 [Geomonas oryzisoli]|uniref:Uncharacterized protein n=1 Tax=Geomonas oryzisoli TaxID=2847992 RepID=A0ABX8J2B8_9BACT|nr:hypothetical protein [Geomonas oryzisoli]QWV92373.1 hypothetical protein KP004_14310 [Geomonas oryzisoli]
MDKVIPIRSNGLNKELLLLRGAFSSYNGAVLVLLRDQNKCEIVLSTEARGVEFKYVKGKSLPDIIIDSTQGNDDNGIMITEEETYVWDGKSIKRRSDKTIPGDELTR